MRYISILLTLLSIPCFSGEIILNRTINWDKKDIGYIDYSKNPGDQQILYFTDASYENKETWFPYYTELIDLENNTYLTEIDIDNLVYVSFQYSELIKIFNLEQLENKISWNTETKYLRKKPMVYFNLLPLRKNPETGEIEKLVSFSIKITTSLKSIEKSEIINEKKSKSFSSSSVLKSGDWFKIIISKSGIYKLTYNELLNIGLSEPENVRVYGNGGKMLPLLNSEPRSDDLQENAIFMEKGADNIFNSSDYILFYAQGPVTWNYSESEEMFLHKMHDYSSYSSYFLTSSLGAGKKIEEAEIINLPANQTVTNFNAFDYHEKNIENFIGSGRQWFGEEIAFGTYDTAFNFQNLETSIPLKIKINLLSRASTSKTFTVKANSQVVDYLSIGPSEINRSLASYGIQKMRISSFSANTDNIVISIDYNKSLTADRGYLDYMDINAQCKLKLTGEPLFFRNIDSVGLDNITEFRIENGDIQTTVWDITDLINIKKISVNLLNPNVSFKVKTDTLKEFVAFNKNGSFLTPYYNSGNNKIDNQDLHGIQPHKMLIISNPLFLPQAERLAEFHRQKDNFSVYVATTVNIYNEFSSGMRDVSAIRDFVKMVYDKSGNDENALHYLLLFGDGSFNNLLDNSLNPNFIPTYQSENSLSPTSSYVTDDFFGFLDENEGGGNLMSSFLLDIGIGRLPVKDTFEAAAVVNKIMYYNNSQSMEDWRNMILFVGDDNELIKGNLNEYMKQASNLGDIIMNGYPQFAVKKILLDAYKRSTSSNGNRYPEVHRSIIDNINKGILIFNYTGHGGETGITAEHVLMKDDLKNLSNKFFPFFITATCEFSRFDYLAKNEDGKYLEETTAGEAAILNPDGGAIGLITTTRLVYGGENYVLNTKIYDYIFNRDENGDRLRMGDVLMRSKIAANTGTNQLNFVLLGDPALKLALPEWYVVTDSINGKSVYEPRDTLKAFSKISISGHIINKDSIADDKFNGAVYPSLYDKKQQLTTLSNTGGTDPMNFEVQENLIYRGKATVTNGKFTFSFIVPKDISYNIGEGKITYYAENSLIDANGYFSDLFIGGTSGVIIQDNSGPEIELFMNDENFRSGGITDKNPVILANIRDENGINTIGNGIGHDIVGILDGDYSNPLKLNAYFQGDIDSYQSGKIIYQLTNIDPGLHNIEVKVWDINNNSSVSSVDFEVRESRELIIEKLINYPNPVNDYTYFQFEHNMPGADQDIKIDIFDLSGRTVRTLTIQSIAAGYRSEPIEWDTKDSYGNNVQGGIYLYRLTVKTSEGNFAEQFQKLIILK